MHINTLCKIIQVIRPFASCKPHANSHLSILCGLFRAMEKYYWSPKWFCKFTCKNISTKLISHASDHLVFPRTLTLYHFQLLIKKGKIKPRGYEAQQECQLATYLCAYSEIICFCVVPRHNCWVNKVTNKTIVSIIIPLSKSTREIVIFYVAE